MFKIKKIRLQSYGPLLVTRKFKSAEILGKSYTYWFTGIDLRQISL